MIEALTNSIKFMESVKEMPSPEQEKMRQKLIEDQKKELNRYKTLSTQELKKLL